MALCHPKPNKIGKPMGATMARPIGQKAAKKAMAAKPVEDARVTALSNLANAHKQFANMAEVQSDSELLFTEFKMYQDLGMTEEAQITLTTLRELQQQAKRASVSIAAAPASSTSASTSPRSAMWCLEMVVMTIRSKYLMMISLETLTMRMTMQPFRHQIYPFKLDVSPDVLLL
jgi:hypothetical protein